MDNFIFINKRQKKNRVFLPKCYDREDNSITGIYTTNSIRFYKEALEKTFNYEHLKECCPDMSYDDIRHELDYYYSCMDNFDIEDGLIKLKGTGTVQNKDFDFKNGIIIVKCDAFMDVVEKDKIGTYLDNYGFDEKEEIVLSNKVVSLSRNDSKKLKFRFK